MRTLDTCIIYKWGGDGDEMDTATEKWTPFRAIVKIKS